jgi:iron complex outermembrane receptor protein
LPRRSRGCGARAVPLVVLCVATGTAGLEAQAASPSDTTAPADTTPTSRPPIRVIVTRTPESLRDVPGPVTIVDAAARQRAGPRVSLRDALGDVPGVFVADRHNFSLGDRIVIRGAGARSQFGVRGIQVISDGIPLTLPDGQAALGNLDLGSAGRVEVMRGPASSLYGNAAGGVILAESGPFPDGPLSPSARITAGAYGFRQEELGAGGRQGGLAWLFHGAHLRTDGYREHSAAEVWRANLVARDGLPGGGELRAVLNLFQLPLAQNPGGLDRTTASATPRASRAFLIQQGTGERSGQLQGGLSLSLPLPGGHALRSSVWGLGRSVWNPIPDRVIRLGRTAGGVRSVLAASTGLLRWTVGLDAGLQADDRREFENLGVGPDGRAREGGALLNQEEKVLQAGPFVRLEARPATTIDVSAGLRLDAYRFSVRDRLLADGDDSDVRWMSQLSPSVGATWNPLPWLGGYARLGSAFETPTTSELSNRPDGRGGFDPSLGPERTLEAEVGVRGAVSGSRWSWEVAAYTARVRDALVPFESAGGEVYYRNAGRLSRRGLELRTEARPAPWLELRAASSFQLHRYTAFASGAADFSGDREPGVPGGRAFVAARARLPRGIRAEARTTWVDAYPVDDANTARTDAYRVVDLRLDVPVSRVSRGSRLFLALDNLFDERYAGSVVPNAFGGRYYEPAPGRSAYLGIQLGG